MEPAQIKYEHSPKTSSAVLKPGQAGIITKVNFYRNQDYIRGPGIDIGMGLPFVTEVLRPILRLGPHNDHIPTTLEECTDAHLEALSSHKLGMHGMLPLDELVQLRELELHLTATIGNYRSQY